MEVKLSFLMCNSLLGGSYLESRADISHRAFASLISSLAT